jgi:competence ComEA-like helix-hairpin-helix protein
MDGIVPETTDSRLVSSSPKLAAQVAPAAAPVGHPLRLVLFGLLLGVAISGLLLWWLGRPVPATITLEPPVVVERAHTQEQKVLQPENHPVEEMLTSPETEQRSVGIDLAAEDTSESAMGSALVNLNRATAAELEALPGIGPAKATAIMAGRPFSGVDDLDRVDGIGPATIEALRAFVTVE